MVTMAVPGRSNLVGPVAHIGVFRIAVRDAEGRPPDGDIHQAFEGHYGNARLSRQSGPQGLANYALSHSGQEYLRGDQAGKTLWGIADGEWHACLPGDVRRPGAADLPITVIAGKTYSLHPCLIGSPGSSRPRPGRPCYAMKSSSFFTIASSVFSTCRFIS